MKNNFTIKQVACAVVAIVLFAFVIAVAVVFSEEKETKTINQEITKNENTINIAPQEVKITFAEGILNKGYNIKGNVYYTKSKDFAKVYIFGLLAEKDGQIYNCIWANNEEDVSGMFDSINDYAQQVSGIFKSGNITELDDGYSRINHKLLSDWQSL